MSIDAMTQALEYTRPGAIVPVTPETVKILVDALRLAIEQAERQEPVAWKNAAMRLGEELSSVGPDGYYDMTVEQWLAWALDQQPRGKNSLPQPLQEFESTCSETLRAQGKAYPRTCKKCGLGPCIGKPQQVQEIDWKDQYEKQKRRSDMWQAKYEKDIGPIEKAGPVEAQREWVGLTIEEANQLWESTDSDWELMKRTEAKLKEKNT